MRKSSSRPQIRIKEVKDGILVLPDNKYRVILETSSINFELKSEAEQDAIIETFQNFLNSLPGPIQILVRVRELDLQTYLDEFRSQNSNEKLGIYKDQLKNYANFVKTLISGNKIMTRRFYIVVPHSQPQANLEFSVIKGQLKLSCEIIEKGLEKLGMKTRQLGNLEILEMFYAIYNPSKLKNQPLSDASFKQIYNHGNIL